ncbi:MAG: hypothetical protein AAFP19_09930 [Bacteroidota bacterium]
MKKLILLYFALLSTPLFAQDSLLIEYLRSNTQAIALDKGQLSGPGADLLTSAGAQASFFLIGESHGLAETPQWSAALFRAFKKYGYRYYATETGPYTAEFIQSMAAQDNYPQEVAAFLKTYPWSMPFFGWGEEWMLVDAVMEDAKGDEALIWGLDQEFAASFRMHFKRLMEQATTAESQKIAKDYYELCVSLYTEFVTTKNPGKSFMMSAQPEDFQKLRTAFQGQIQSLDLIRELEESAQIYQLWSSRETYRSNCIRAEMMKKHFCQYYTVAKEREKQPKVLFKFGLNHMFRGASALNIYDIGNFVSELASQEQSESFHLVVLGRKGTVNAYTPFSSNKADQQKSYDALESYREFGVASILAATSETEASVVDFRPLRKALFDRVLKVENAMMERMIWSYDAILVLPEVHASSYLGK